MLYFSGKYSFFEQNIHFNAGISRFIWPSYTRIGPYVSRAAGFFIHWGLGQNNLLFYSTRTCVIVQISHLISLYHTCGIEYSEQSEAERAGVVYLLGWFSKKEEKIKFMQFLFREKIEHSSCWIFSHNHGPLAPALIRNGP